jgi:hypothetical protein
VDVADEKDSRFILIILGTVGRKSVPLPNAMRDDTAAPVVVVLTGGKSREPRSCVWSIRKNEVARARNILTVRNRKGRNAEHKQDSSHNYRLIRGRVDDALGVVEAVGLGGVGAPIVVLAGGVGAPIVVLPANPLAPFRTLMLFMFGSERNPIPDNCRLGSVKTKALSLEISFRC